MIRLDFPGGLRWIDLPGGVCVQARPVDAAVYQAAQSMARQTLYAAAAAMSAGDGSAGDGDGRTAGGIDPGGIDWPHPPLAVAPAALAGWDSAALRQGVAEDLLVRALAQLTIVDWRGVMLADGTGPAPCAPAPIDALMAGHPIVADRYFAEILRPLDALVAEGNGCARAPAGIGAAAAPTAGAAPTLAPPAPTAGRA